MQMRGMVIRGKRGGDEGVKNFFKKSETLARTTAENSIQYFRIQPPTRGEGKKVFFFSSSNNKGVPIIARRFHPPAPAIGYGPEQSHGRGICLAGATYRWELTLGRRRTEMMFFGSIFARSSLGVRPITKASVSRLGGSVCFQKFH